MLRGAWTHRSLVVSLVRRQYQVRYRQSAMGLLWAVLLPLAILGAGTLLFRGVMRVDTGSTPYGLSTMAALVPWTFFASSLLMGATSVTGSLPMITRLAFPRVALPLSMVGLALVDLAVATAIFAVLAAVLGAGVPVTAAWFPVLLAVEIPLVVGLVLLVSAANVFARDVRLAIPLLTQLWLILTPVLYDLRTVPAGLRPLYVANPMTGLVESFRGVLVTGTPPSLELLLPSIVGAVVLFLAGAWYFSAVEDRFADVI